MFPLLYSEVVENWYNSHLNFGFPQYNSLAWWFSVTDAIALMLPRVIQMTCSYRVNYDPFDCKGWSVLSKSSDLYLSRPHSFDLFPGKAILLFHY